MPPECYTNILFAVSARLDDAHSYSKRLLPAGTGLTNDRLEIFDYGIYWIFLTSLKFLGLTSSFTFAANASIGPDQPSFEAFSRCQRLTTPLSAVSSSHLTVTDLGADVEYLSPHREQTRVDGAVRVQTYTSVYRWTNNRLFDELRAGKVEELAHSGIFLCFDTGNGDVANGYVGLMTVEAESLKNLGQRILRPYEYRTAEASSGRERLWLPTTLSLLQSTAGCFFR